MSFIEKSIEVNVPVRTAYNQWTQFEEFPRFLEAVQEVKQLDNTRLHWRAEIAGKQREWDAEIYEQMPDQLIAWRSLSGAKHAGRVQFDKIDNNRCRIHLRMEYEPEGVVENVGDTLGLVEGRVQGDLERFKTYIESRGQETGAWRGEIHGGQEEQRRAG